MKFSTKHLRVYWLTCVYVILASSAFATTIVMPTDEQLVAKSPVIVEGRVVRSVPVDRDGAIWTETTLAVERVLKGRVEATITIAEIGGTLSGAGGERITKVFGAPEYREGERVLVFIEELGVRTGNPAGSESTPRRYRTIDLFVGKFAEERIADGRRLWFRDESDPHVTLLDAGFRPIEAVNVQRDAARFESFVSERIAGREGARNYGIENPVLRPPTRDGGPFQQAPNFTLISEPSVYRWAGFDSGQTASWYSAGTQPGYTGGGSSEISTAITTWTSYASAKILYAFAGASPAPPGGLSANNGRNEVMLNDPLSEIAGTWNRNTGGVVGQGGFSGVTFGGNWIAPFAADASHPAGTMRAYSITEGNLVIQDGVSPGTGISSTRLAEIIAHEFGHTLGFGHSADNSALMWSSVTGIGPSLRADDQLAARWLYPNGSSTPPPPPQVPATPSNLIASLAGSSVILQWSDSANNETGYSVYYAAGSGAFTKLGDVSANATSATLNGFTAGSYRFYVVAFNSSGQSSPSNTAAATVGGTAAASFSLTPQSGTANATTFTFYDESTGSVTSRLWTFGDGATSTAFVATHVYASPGLYTVTLTVTGSSGAQSQASRTVNVNGPLAAAFAFTPVNPTTDDTIAFVDQTTGGVTSWAWSFGDGTSSTSPNPAKRYNSPGTYTVSLTAVRNAESSYVTKNIAVSSPLPAQPPVIAAFDLTPGAPVAGQGVTFIDRSSGSPNRWTWSFGDGSSSTAQNPVHAFAAPGTYGVSLTSSNGITTSVATKAIIVASQLVPFRALIPVSAQTPGAGGSVWRTELSLFNAGDEAATGELLFIPGSGGTLQSRALYLAPRQSLTYANALLDVFGMTSGAGAIAIEASSATTLAKLKVSSRTFTVGQLGTYGQSVPPLSQSDGDATQYLTGMASSAAYRTNIGLVNRGSTVVAATLTLLDATGAIVGINSLTIPPNNFQQASLATYFPAVNGRTFDALSMRVDGAVTAYASVIDNLTQDPIYIQALRAPSGSSLLLPVVGRAPGANGTFWRSDVTFFNPAAARQILTLRYLGASKTLALNGGDTIVLADIVSTMSAGSGSGALEVTCNGATGPIVTSRTYTTASSGGTFGQSIDPVAAFTNDVWIPGLRSDASFRSNAGFVNGGNATLVSVRLLSPAGSEIASTTIALASRAQQQYSLGALFPGINIAALGTVTLHAHSEGTLFAYGSLVDNASGDPVFFAGE